jgi:chromosome segregation ATPase
MVPNVNLSDITHIAVIVCGGFLAYVGQRNKNQIQDKVEELRKDFEELYVPEKVDTLKHENLTQRITHIETEIMRNRDGMHDLRTQFTTLIMGKLERIELQLNDKVRRMTNIETKLETLDELMHDLSDRMHDLERQRQ